MISVEELLAPVAADAPAGPDLAYDVDRQRIEQAFDAAAQGDTEVDWRETVASIEAQSRRTKDVWLAVYLARGGARLGRLEMVETGCRMLAGLFELYWDSVHPTLDEYGLQGRKGPCESLTRIGEFLGPLRRTTLVEHPRLGSYSGEDFERYASGGEAIEGYGQFRAALSDTSPDALQLVVARIDGIRKAIVQADAILTEQAAISGETGTNFQTTYAAIDALRRSMAHFIDGVEQVKAPASAPAPAAPAVPSAAQVDAAPGGVESREDVVRTLDLVIGYYERCEPASPIPLALRRVKGWTTMDFMAILKDITPGGVSEAGAVLLTRGADEGGNTW